MAASFLHLAKFLEKDGKLMEKVLDAWKPTVSRTETFEDIVTASRDELLQGCEDPEGATEAVKERLDLWHHEDRRSVLRSSDPSTSQQRKASTEGKDG
jgi:hypothetical protein